LKRNLEREWLAYKALADGLGIPHLHWFGTDFNYQVLVIDRLGPSLEDLLSRSSSGKFTIGTVAQIACQTVSS
jgi:hypothetical protein